MISKLGDKANTIGFKELEDQDAKNRAFAKHVGELVQQRRGVKEAQTSDDAVDRLVDEINKSADPDKDKCLVFFTRYSDENDKSITQIPVVALNYRTMYAVDLINSKALGTQ